MFFDIIPGYFHAILNKSMNDNAIKRREKNLMIDYSIHTLELQTFITNIDRCYIAKLLKPLHPSIQLKTVCTKKGLTKTACIYRKLPYYGINSIILYSISYKDNISTNLIFIDINPYNVLHSYCQSSSNIIEAREINRAINAIYDSLSQILQPKIINALTLNRLDFCANLIFTSQIQAEEYIKLLKRGVPSKVLSERKHLDEKQHRYIPYKDSLLLGCKSYSFQIYPKYVQMQNHNMKNTDGATGMVRFELRAKKAKLEQLAHKYNIISPKENCRQFLINAPFITRQEIPEIVSKMAGCHNFYKYHEIKSRILDSDFKTDCKTQMLDILDYLSRHSSSEDLLADLHLTQKEWKNIIKKFDQLGCSPIPISKSYKYAAYPGVINWSSII